MKLQNLISNLPSVYDAEFEKVLVEAVVKLKVTSLTNELTELLAFSITEQYNKLAKAILEKDYQGKKLDMQAINKAILAQNGEGYSLLHFTSQFGNKEMLFYFLDHGVEISFDKEGSSLIHALNFAEKLKQEDFCEIISKLEALSPGIINHKNSSNLSALHYAAQYNNMELFKSLIICGAEK